MKLGTIVAPTIKELFEKRIQDLILSGELKIGSKLPTEREMAEEMGISKSIVHMGVKTLEQRGFLEIKPRHGIRVANYPENGNVDTLVALFTFHDGRLDQKNMISMIQFRESIESTAISLAIENYSPENIARLRYRADLLIKTVNESPEITDEDVAQLLFEYHHCVNIISGNTVIPMISNAFHDISIVFWKTWLLNQNDRQPLLDFIEQFTELIEKKEQAQAINLLKLKNRQLIGWID